MLQASKSSGKNLTLTAKGKPVSQFGKGGSNRSSPRTTPDKALSHTYNSDKKNSPRTVGTKGTTPEDEKTRNKSANPTQIKTNLGPSKIKAPKIKIVTLRIPDSSEKTEEAGVKKKNIDISHAAMKVLKSSVLLENKSCENISVSIRVRPFTQQETSAKQTREAWTLTPTNNLADRKRGIAYAFGISLNLLHR